MPRNTKDFRQQPESGRKTGDKQTLPGACRASVALQGPWGLDLEPPELRENECLLFEATQFAVLCINLTQVELKNCGMSESSSSPDSDEQIHISFAGKEGILGQSPQPAKLNK